MKLKLKRGSHSHYIETDLDVGWVTVEHYIPGIAPYIHIYNRMFYGHQLNTRHTLKLYAILLRSGY